MSTNIYWFRNDLRLADNAAWHHACHTSSRLLPVYIHDPVSLQNSRWGFARTGTHRQQFLRQTLTDLQSQLRAQGSGLLQLEGTPQQLLPMLAEKIGADKIIAEDIAAPEEQDQVAALRGLGLAVETFWQSSLLDPADLPFSPTALPSVFTAFKQAVERSSQQPPVPIASPVNIAALPDVQSLNFDLPLVSQATLAHDTRSSFPYFSPAFAGGESAATAHVRQYFSRKLAHTYKATRNDLSGVDYSSKFSPWLASGAISARSIYFALKQFEAEHGANDSTYWLWFELLWRDYFRFLHLQYGKKLYRARGLTETPSGHHDENNFTAWCRGNTGEPLVDAGMRELAATGYLSNRLRQIVASYLVHDLQCDWRAGAAWFEAQLIDYDVYSNQGNWLYIAGRGTDPRGGRRFNPRKQAVDYDSGGNYQNMWENT